MEKRKGWGGVAGVRVLRVQLWAMEGDHGWNQCHPGRERAWGVFLGHGLGIMDGIMVRGWIVGHLTENARDCGRNGVG